MKSRQIDHSPKRFILVFETGDELAKGLLEFAEQEKSGWNACVASMAPGLKFVAAGLALCIRSSSFAKRRGWVLEDVRLHYFLSNQIPRNRESAREKA